MSPLSPADLPVRVAEPADDAWRSALLSVRWGGTTVVSRGTAYDAMTLPALVAGDRDGLATYEVRGDQLEVLTLDSLQPGAGTSLLTALAAIAAASGCRRAWLVTGNDNLAAVRFYQRRGWRLVAVHPGGVDVARRHKPSIPTEVDGIALHDEWELELPLSPPG